jgi:predicted nuclease with TOPRIM domain
MNIQNNTKNLNKILEEFSKDKVELASHKGERIDLNIVNTINKIISSVDNEKKKLDNAVNKYYDKILDLPNEFSSINESLLFKEISKLKNEVKSAKEKAKEFGLTEKSLPILNDATMTIFSAEEMLEEYQSALKVNKKLSNLL